MSGHSKWNNIKRKKEKTDSQKGRVFTRIGREIMMAVREGGANPDGNAKLRDVIAKAKANNVPNDNIERSIKKAASMGEGANYESITYEGYGPGGVAVIVDATTDNRNRTAGELRHYFDKFGGNLGQTGSVGFLFNQKGVIVLEAEDLDEEDIMLAALDAGAEDFQVEDDLFEVTTAPEDFSAVREALEAKNCTFVSADVAMVPITTVALSTEDEIENMRKLLDMLDDNDDVQNVWNNWEEPDDED